MIFGVLSAAQPGGKCVSIGCPRAMQAVLVIDMLDAVALLL